MNIKKKITAQEPSIEKLEERIEYGKTRISGIISSRYVIPNGKRVNKDENGKYLTPDGNGVYRDENGSICSGEYIKTQGEYKVSRTDIDDMEQYISILEYQLEKARKKQINDARKKRKNDARNKEIAED